MKIFTYFIMRLVCSPLSSFFMPHNEKKLGILALGLISPLLLVAQIRTPRGTIQGKVIDAEDQHPVTGTTIILKENQNSTVTDEKGSFSLNFTNPTDTLIITHIGYQSRQIPINELSGNAITITLEKAETRLQEVVVSTGYQQIPKERATGSFDFIGNKELNRSVSSNILERLDGIASGLIFNKSTLATGLNNNESSIAIRGRSTIYANPNPLIIVDNFPYDGNINAINPNDIESITILKDAAAASIWGAFSGNGVIVITTKRGKYNHPLEASFNSHITIGDKPNIFYTPSISSKDYIDAEKYLFNNGYYKSKETAWNHPALSPAIEILIAKRDGVISDVEADSKLNSLGNQDIRNDESDFFYRKSIKQQYSLNFSGGSKNNLYYFGIGYDRDISNVIGNNNNRITFNTSNTYSLLNKKIELTSTISYSQETIQENGISNIPVGYPYLKLIDSLGNPLPIPYSYRMTYIDTAGSGKLLDWHYSPLEEIKYGNNSTKSVDYRIGFQLKYNIFNGLNANINYQFSQGRSNQNNIRSQQTFYVRDLINQYSQINYQTGEVIRPVPLGAILDQRNSEYKSENVRGQINYSHSWKNSHNITALAGMEIRNINSFITLSRDYGYDNELKTSIPVDYVNNYPLYYSSFFKRKISDNNLYTGTINHFLSYFTNIAYSYKDKYVLSLSARKDASNIFGVKTNEKGVPLWSVGSSWNISNEDFYHLKWLPYARLRITDGYNGNVDNTLSSSITASASSLNQFNTPYISIVNPPNPLLRWEKVNTVNIGIDFSSYNNIISGSVEYYTKKGKDLIGTSPVDPTTGVISFKGNLANMKGEGLDVSLKTQNISRRLKWATTFLFSYSSSKVTKYAYNPNEFASNLLNLNINPIVGKPLYAIYSYKWAGLDSQTGNPQVLLDGKPSSDYSNIYTSTNLNNLKFFGPANPIFYGSLINLFQWKGFSLSFNITYKFGYYFRKPSIQYGDFLTNNRLPNADFGQRWREPGDEDNTNIPSFIYPINTLRDFIYSNSDILIEKGDHIRLQDIKLSYQLKNRKWSKISKGVLIYGYVNDIGIIWKATKSTYDPDYLFSLPNPIQYSLGIKTGINP